MRREFIECPKRVLVPASSPYLPSLDASMPNSANWGPSEIGKRRFREAAGWIDLIDAHGKVRRQEGNNATRKPVGLRNTGMKV